MSDKSQQTYSEWAYSKYSNQYESWVPWLEDKYLAWTGQNKSSYVAKDNLDKTKITGNQQIDDIQEGVNKGVSGQLGKGGLLEGVGNLTSKEVFTRSERGGKDDKGGYGI